MSKYKNVELVKPSGLELKDRLVSVNRVTKVTKGGRAFGFSAIVVVGDEHGVVGHGLGKSKDVSEAIAKAVEDAKKNLVRIPLSGQSVPHEQKRKIWWSCCLLNACVSRYRSYCRWCCTCGIRVSWGTRRIVEISRFIKPSQRS